MVGWRVCSCSASCEWSFSFDELWYAMLSGRRVILGSIGSVVVSNVERRGFFFVAGEAVGAPNIHQFDVKEVSI